MTLRFELPENVLVRDFGKSVVVLKETSPEKQEFKIGDKPYRKVGSVERKPNRGGWENEGGLPTAELAKIITKAGGRVLGLE